MKPTTMFLSLVIATQSLPASAGTLVVSPVGNGKGTVVSNQGLPSQNEIKGKGIANGTAKPKANFPWGTKTPGNPDVVTNKTPGDPGDSTVEFNF